MKTQINQYEKRAHAVGISMWHLEWKPKYAYKMFAKIKYKNLCAACIRQAAMRHRIKIIELEVMPEHVHCSIGIALSMSPSQALQILKGLSAYLFFRYHPKARLRYPKGHLWSRGKFAASVGFVQIETVNAYVRNQEEHHASGNSTL